MHQYCIKAQDSLKTNLSQWPHTVQTQEGTFAPCFVHQHFCTLEETLISTHMEPELQTTYM
jgi:hypothetical protein